MSARSPIDSSEAFKSEKMCALSERPDGRDKLPVWVEKIVCPFATVTPIREAPVQGCTSVRLSASRIAIYVPLDPESALVFSETEKKFPLLVPRARRG